MKRIDFLTTDGVILNGLLYDGTNKAEDVILAVHGMSSNCFKDRDKIFSTKANEANIDYFCFNNRGSDLVRYINKNDDKILGGTSYEDVLESYEDIVGAIIKLKDLGYKNIYLLGHSLGCTKIVYTYNELKDEESEDILPFIKGIILLSLVDVPESLKFYLNDKFDEYLKLAEEKESNGESSELMPKESFIHPISVKTFLRYAKNNKEIDFAKYGNDDKLEKLNNIDTEIKNYTLLKKEYEKLEKKFNNFLNIKEDTRHE